MLRDRPSFPVWFQNFPPHDQAIRQRANYLSLVSKFVLGTRYELKQRDFITNENNCERTTLSEFRICWHDAISGKPYDREWPIWAIEIFLIN